jgi:tRNA dimethylallyltransferase
VPSPTSALLLAGPTAIGKSAIALQLAARLGGEIVGADAFQVYAGVPILTAQPSTADRSRVPHHLIGVIPLTHAFDVAQYLALARGALEEIRRRGRVPIVVGGTGLYLRALLRGLADLPPADEGVRAELAALSLAELQAELKERDPVGAGFIDLQNPRRVIRALEVCRLTGRPFSSFRREWEQTDSPEFRGYVLTRTRDDLYRRIDARVEAMFREGVEEEVAALGEVGPTAGQVLGLREIRERLAGRLTRAECIAAIQQATRRYAKRQLTWFAKEPALQPLDAEADLRGVME